MPRDSLTKRLKFKKMKPRDTKKRESHCPLLVSHIEALRIALTAETSNHRPHAGLLVAILLH